MEKILEEISSLGEEFIVYRLRVLDDNFTYLLAQNGLCVSIDPGDDEPVRGLISELNLELEAILVTHFHKDHSGGAKGLKGEKKLPILGPKHKELPFLDQVIADGDEISLGPFSMTVIHAPGHTMEHVMYYFQEIDLLFCGDVLFLGGCGKILEGNEHHYFHALEKIKNLPLETRIFAGHDYNKRNIEFIQFLDPTSVSAGMKEEDTFHTLEQEMAINPFLKAKTPPIFNELHQKCKEFNT